MAITKVLEIPRHIARSKALITMRGATYDPTSGVSPLAVISSVQVIGNVTSIEIPNNRGSAERRELNAATLGRIIEIVPGLVDFEGFQLNHVITYQQTFLEACGFGGHALDYQSTPMLFTFDLPTPNTAFAPARTLVATGCFIKNNPMQFSVEEKEDLRITQQVQIAIAQIFEL